MAGAVDLSALKRPAGPAAAAGAAELNIPGAVEITEANFEAEALIRSGEVPVVVVLWTPRSEASVQLAETLGALAGQDNGKWVVATVNVDTTPRVAQAFGVQKIPTVVALAAGQPLSNFEGMQPPEQLRLWVDSLLDATAGKLSGGAGAEEAEQVDPAVAAAREHLDAGNLEEAKAAYEAILANEPGNTEAAGAVRQVGFLIRASGQQPDAIAVADADPSNIEAAFAAADVQVLNQDVSGAFDRLIALVKRTAGDERGTVRARLVELFELFDPADPEVIAGRRNLANALF